MNFLHLSKLINFMPERELIRRRKERGDSWPWTKDPILRGHRFCNINRENDKTTRWLDEN